MSTLNLNEAQEAAVRPNYIFWVLSAKNPK